MTRMAKLKGLESLEAFRASLPPGPQKTVFEDFSTGCKVSEPACSLCKSESYKTYVGADHARPCTKDQAVLQVGAVVPANGCPTPPDSMKRLAVMAMLGRTLPTAIDEGQIVGELLEWLEIKGHIQKNTKAHLQQQFFEERG